MIAQHLTDPAETGETITATLADGPLENASIEVEVVEGRPSKVVDVSADDRSTCGRSAGYTFLYRI
jgi:hypothetical protein